MREIFVPSLCTKSWPNTSLPLAPTASQKSELRTPMEPCDWLKLEVKAPLALGSKWTVTALNSRKMIVFRIFFDQWSFFLPCLLFFLSALPFLLSFSLYPFLQGQKKQEESTARLVQPRTQSTCCSKLMYQMLTNHRALVF